MQQCLAKSAMTSLDVVDYLHEIFVSKEKVALSLIVDSLIIKYFISLPEYQELVRDAL